MQPEAISEARDWLERADLDLRLAERALRIPPALAGGAAYHAQQAAEKALKAFLAAHNEPFPHTHNLTVLLPRCQALDAAFGQLGGVAASLTPFATQFRQWGRTTHSREDVIYTAAYLVGSILAHRQWRPPSQVNQKAPPTRRPQRSANKICVRGPASI